MQSAHNSAFAAQLRAVRPGIIILLCWLLTGTAPLRAQETPATNPAPAAATASLQFQDASYSVASWNVPIRATTAVFKKEPNLGATKPYRGSFQFGSNPTNAMAFVWDRAAKKLYLDLNRNQDLTDDSAGVFAANAQSANYQSFPNVRLTLQTQLGPLPLVADLGFYAYGNPPSCHAQIRSFWQGQLTLAGQDYQVGLVPSDFNQLCLGDKGRLLLRPWSARAQAFSSFGNSVETIPSGSRLFIRDHAFQIECSPASSVATPQLTFRLTEQHPALGELRLPGKFIHRLLLQDGPYQVVLEQPKKVVRIPVGKYNQLQVWLKVGASEAHRDTRQTTIISETQPATCTAGGPLTNSVTVSGRGRLLTLNYEVLGADGGKYELATQDRSQPPRFTIQKDGKVLAAGKFEFG